MKEIPRSDRQITVTSQGRELVFAIRHKVQVFIKPAYGSISSEYLSAARSVVREITVRLSEVLEAP